MKTFFTRNEVLISRLATLMIFLALIRTILEPIRLQHYSSTPVTVKEIELYLYGGLVCAIGLAGIVVSLYSHRYKTITGLAGLVIVILLLLKLMYSK